MSDIDWDEFTDPMLPEEVAALFGVDPATVITWANDRKLDCFRTLGGHRRYPLGGVRYWYLVHGPKVVTPS